MSMPICSDEMRTMYGMRLDNCAKDDDKAKKSEQIWVLSPKLTWDCGKTPISIQSLAFYSILDPPLVTPSPQNTVRVTNSTKRKISKCWKTAGSFRDPWPCFCLASEWKNDGTSPHVSFEGPGQVCLNGEFGEWNTVTHPPWLKLIGCHSYRPSNKYNFTFAACFFLGVAILILSQLQLTIILHHPKEPDMSFSKGINPTILGMGLGPSNLL